MTEERNCIASPCKYAIVQFWNGPSKSKERYKRYIVICTKWTIHNGNKNYFYWPYKNWVQNKADTVNNVEVDCSTWIKFHLLQTVQYTNNFFKAVQTCAALHYFCVDASDHNFIEMYERIAPHLNCNDPDMNEIHKITRSLTDEDEKVDVDTRSSAFSQTPLEVFGSSRKVSQSVVDTQLSPTLEDRKTALDPDAETANKICQSPNFLSRKKRHRTISVNVATQSPTFLDQKNSSSAAGEMVNNNKQSPSFLSPTKHHASINYTNLGGQLSKSTLEEITSSTTEVDTASSDWQSPSFLSPRKREAEKDASDDETQWSPSLLDGRCALKSITSCSSNHSTTRGTPPYLLSRKSCTIIRKHKPAASRCLINNLEHL